MRRQLSRLVSKLSCQDRVFGRHCIPLDPYYLAWKADRFGLTSRFVELAGEINSSMPQKIIERLELALRGFKRLLADSSILILGLTYKRDVEDIRESRASRSLIACWNNERNVVFHDPLFRLRKRRRARRGLQRVELARDVLKSKDAVVIVTDHSTYDWAWIVEQSRPFVVDMRNATHGVVANRDRIVRA